MQVLDIRSSDETRLRCVRWSPSDRPKAHILLCHGLAEHMGRYEHVAAALTAAGYAVVGIELRGHGHSDGKRGHVDRWTDYVADLSAAAEQIDGPIIAFAHSMGGLVTLDYLRTADRIRAVVLTAPLLGVAVKAPKIKVMGARLLSRLIPNLSMGNELDASLICSDSNIVDAYTADPLVFDTLTPRWFTEMKKALVRVNEHASAYTVPLLAMWGADDRIVSTRAIDLFCNQWGSAVTRKSWPRLYHEILNEPQQDEILAEIITWLDQQAMGEVS